MAAKTKPRATASAKLLEKKLKKFAKKSRLEALQRARRELNG